MHASTFVGSGLTTTAAADGARSAAIGYRGDPDETVPTLQNVTIVAPEVMTGREWIHWPPRSDRQGIGMQSSTPRSLLRAVCGIAGLWLCLWLLLWPALEIVRAIRDPWLGGPKPASQAWRWHRALTPVFAEWAQQRQRSLAATQLGIDDISGTEWPLFGAVYYLRATENLDRAWQANPVADRPVIHARTAIDAAAALLADPKQASWVQVHWGADRYLRTENVFYRMLLIDGLATHARLLGNSPYQDLLRAQVEGLAAELSASATGLLADYPGQTFPADVAAAWHAIVRADAVLGTDHREAATRALRGFIGAMSPTGELPPYAWLGSEPEPTVVRGSANAWLLHHAPFLWPDQSERWFDAHTRDFWQQGWWLSGYREFTRSSEAAYYHDVDSGPVIAGLGTSASAFGIGAARSVGAHGEARSLGLLAVVLSWPLPNGRLLAPRLLSDVVDAPLLGEAAILYNLSQPAAPGFAQRGHAEGGAVPGMVWVILLLQLAGGALGCWVAMRWLRSAFRGGLRAPWR